MTILSIALIALLVQNPPNVRAPSASIEGVVTSVGTGDPLSKATVELRTDDLGAGLPRAAAATDDGRFVFQNVRPGRCQLVATRSGYVRAPLAITVAGGQQVANIRLPMTPGSAIFGRVFDDRGEPIGQVEVRALKASYRDGHRALTVVQSVDTNDLGEYRLFWLPPGRYYVAAVHGGGEIGLVAGGGFSLGGGPNGAYVLRGTADSSQAAPVSVSDADHYVPIYFPGTSDEQVASAIDLRAGVDSGELNIIVAPVHEHRVRGTVVDGTTGQAAQYGGLRRTSGLLRPFEDVDPSSGAFELELLPGSHTLMATAGEGVGYAVVQVGDADIDDVRIVTAPTFSMSARIVIEGRTSDGSDLASLRVSLRRDPAIPGTSSSSYSVPLPNGTFALEASPGDYRVNVAPIPGTPSPPFARLPQSLEGAFVKSIRLGNADVLNGGLHLQKSPENALEIVIGTSPGAVVGRVVGARQGPAADVSVVLVPDVRARAELYKIVAPDSSGLFRFDRVAPGDYRVFAWADLENGSWFDPDFMRTQENSGAPIRVGEGKTENVQVTLLE